MENDKWERIRNYKQNSNNLDSLENEIQNHFQNIITNPNIELLQVFYEYLSNKNNLQGIEYRCLCWLDMIYNLPTDLNKPFLNEPVFMEISEFKKEYLISERRIELFNLLNDFVSDKMEQSNLDNLIILIGGSFTDLNIEKPNDMDLGIIKPDNLDEHNTDFNEYFQYALKSIPKELDIEFLPKSLDKSSFKVFSRIVALGNNAEIKEKLELKVNTNSFEPRKIVKLKIKTKC
tara:strand:+ start:2132 stop:2830 length:699 start_codon:yes stop_codon:yes gene_type:complete